MTRSSKANRPSPALVTDPEERESLVCNLFCQGKSVQEILDELRDRVPMTRERPYAIVRHAARQGRLSYTPPHESGLALEIMETYRLEKVRVVKTAESSDVAGQAARMLSEMIRKWPQPDLHIGFAGGGLLQETVRLLAESLRRPGPAPRNIFFHALIAAAHDPMNSPNAFLHWFLGHGFTFKPHFIGLPAPGFVSTPTLRKLRQLEGIKEAFDRAGELDIVVTSAGAHWKNGCSALHQMYRDRASADVMKLLEQAGVVGDIIWQPLSAQTGPIRLETGVRAVTLIDLDRLPSLIANKKSVVLVLGPCGTCHRPKSEILSAILNWKEPLITHLVTDTRTAHGVCGIERPAKRD